MTAAADRHLLIGLFALQTGMIQQAQLVAAFHAWTCDKARSLADHLIALGHLSAAQRAAVEALAALQIETHGGDIEKSLAAIPAGRLTRASLANLGDPDIEATLGHVGPGRGLTDDNGQVDAESTTDYSVGRATSDGQRFRIVRPHARGGLGAVFVAVDGELHREVALKQILEKHADDPVSRQRFVAEAEITGGLEHPGVVPVYGLGTDGAGRPYYAMRFIKGESLKDAITRFHEDAALKTNPGRRSLELRKLLRRFTDVCNAVDYAHSRGVIHRDIKPANIIVGKHGETLVVDWGLAKSVGRADPSVGEQTIAPSSSGSSETLPGSALGTPAYMSPEQARGDLNRLGSRSDVYSLGATLYCLLTGAPPFGGEDIGAVLGAVQEGRFPRLALLDPSLDKALEAVCLKAMALRPEERYASPRLLAEDIERWMADEPVSAWRERLPRRARRWGRRNRTAVAAVAVAVVAGVIGLSSVAAVQTKANAELTRSNAAVQVRYDLAVAAIKTFHTGVSEDFLLKEDQFKGLRDRLLKSASDFYSKLGTLLGKETDFASRRALAQSNFELAQLTSKIGRKEDALAAHRAVLAARESLAAEPGSDVQMKVDVGRSLIEVASLLRDTTGKADEALATFRSSESLLANLAGSDATARAALAVCRMQMSFLLNSAGKLAEALVALKLARADQEALAAVPGASIDIRRELAETCNEIGFHLWQSSKQAEAELEFRAAMPIYQKLVDENPTVPEFRRGLAVCHFYLGNVLPALGKPAEAEVEFRAAIELEQRLMAENPAVTKLRRSVAISRHYFGGLLEDMGRAEEAGAELGAALSIAQQLVDDNATDTELSGLLAGCHDKLGVHLLQIGKLSEAEVECRTAVAITQKLEHENPSVANFRAALARSLICMGDVLRLSDRPSEAKVYYDRAIALLQALGQTLGRDILVPLMEPSMRKRGLTLRDLGELAGAAADLRLALELCHKVPSELRPEFDFAFCHAALAGLAGRSGSGISAAEGENHATMAMQWLHRMVARGGRNSNLLRIESALDPLRSREDFQLLMLDVAFPAEPFAPDR